MFTFFLHSMEVQGRHHAVINLCLSLEKRFSVTTSFGTKYIISTPPIAIQAVLQQWLPLVHCESLTRPLSVSIEARVEFRSPSSISETLTFFPNQAKCATELVPITGQLSHNQFHSPAHFDTDLVFCGQPMAAGDTLLTGCIALAGASWDWEVSFSTSFGWFQNNSRHSVHHSCHLKLKSFSS